MKTNNMIIAAAFALSISVLHGAAGASEVELPIMKSLKTALGTLTIRGNFSQEDYGIAVQSWCQSVNGVVAVAAKGGIAKTVAKALAAQVPGELEHRRDFCTRQTAVLDHIIAKLNEAYTTPYYNIGVSDPNELDVTYLAVLLVCTSDSSKVVKGSRHNIFGEANVVPKPVWRESSNIETHRVQLVEDCDTAPVLCWDPTK